MDKKLHNLYYRLVDINGNPTIGTGESFVRISIGATIAQLRIAIKNDHVTRFKYVGIHRAAVFLPDTYED